MYIFKFALSSFKCVKVEDIDRDFKANNLYSKISYLLSEINATRLSCTKLYNRIS